MKGNDIMKQVEIRIWNAGGKDLVEVFVDGEFWFDKCTNDLFSLLNFISDNIECEMKVKYMN